MIDTQLRTLDQVEAFLNGTLAIEFSPVSQAEKYQWIKQTLVRFDYPRLKKPKKGLIRRYMIKMTGYSRQQLTRLIHQYNENKTLGRRRQARKKFSGIYTRKDISLLAKTDELHDKLSGPTIKKICERAYKIFGKPEYQRLASISVSHLYNLRKTTVYQKQYQHFEKTKRSKVAIGERRKPVPNGEAGYLRVDTVHQGDLDKQKGVYHINAVDEVTQFQIIFAAEKISEQYLIPGLKYILESFPFEIKGFHSDNGSEYINKEVAKLLNKLLIEFTKSRARKSNDNALAESKNGSTIRKCLGYIHIPQKWAPDINEFYQNCYIDYLNYHRPCYFPREKADKKGKIKKVYLYDDMMTPYEKFISLENVDAYLKPEITLETLAAKAKEMSDNESAELVQLKRKALFELIFNDKVSARSSC